MKCKEAENIYMSDLVFSELGDHKTGYRECRGYMSLQELMDDKRLPMNWSAPIRSWDKNGKTVITYNRTRTLYNYICKNYYLGFNGFSDARSIGDSKSHINGERGDLRYLSKNRNGEAVLLQSASFNYEMQVKFCKALYLFGWAANGKHFMLSENFIYKGETTLLPYCHHYRTENVRHNNHLHLQGFNFNHIKEVKL